MKRRLQSHVHRCRKRTSLAHIAGRLDALAVRRISFPDEDSRPAWVHLDRSRVMRPSDVRRLMPKRLGDLEPGEVHPFPQSERIFGANANSSCSTEGEKVRAWVRKENKNTIVPRRRASEASCRCGPAWNIIRPLC